MSSPLKSIGQFLFGGGGQSTPPMMIPPAVPAPPPPLQSPTGTSASLKPKGQSYLASAAPVVSSANTGGKSLLGQ